LVLGFSIRYLSVDGQAASIAAAAGETDLLTVALARREGNLRLAERQLLQRLLNAQTASHQVPALETLPFTFVFMSTFSFFCCAVRFGRRASATWQRC